MKRVASPGSMHDTGCLGLVHWDNPEGWQNQYNIVKFKNKIKLKKTRATRTKNK